MSNFSGTSKNEVIFQISHGKICELEMKKEEVEDESDDEVIVEAPISPFRKQQSLMIPSSRR